MGMHTDFAYKEDPSSGSGFDRDLIKQASNKSRDQTNWMRQSKNEVDIDEIPIPTAGEGPKTFEELLAEKMEAE